MLMPCGGNVAKLVVLAAVLLPCAVAQRVEPEVHAVEASARAAIDEQSRGQSPSQRKSAQLATRSAWMGTASRPPRSLVPTPRTRQPASSEAEKSIPARGEVLSPKAKIASSPTRPTQPTDRRLVASTAPAGTSVMPGSNHSRTSRKKSPAKRPENRQL